MRGEADQTSVTLLVRLRKSSADEGAWQEFVARYRPRIYSLCLTYLRNATDAEDATQEVLLGLLGKLRRFNYDPSQSFRGWLRAVTRSVLCDFQAERYPDQGSGDSAVQRLLASAEAREELAQQLEAEFDQELLQEAMRRVQTRVPRQQWDAFRLTALEGLTGAEAAAKLGMLVATVYTAKSKVQKAVREEVARLESEQV